MQLVAYGAQDIYLTGNPQITFFKVVYRRHTNFSMEAIEQTWNGQSDGTNGRCTATISRNGDLVHRMYFEVTGKMVNQGLNLYNPGVAWIKSVELEIGGQKIDKHSGTWMETWAELTQENPSATIGFMHHHGNRLRSNASTCNVFQNTSGFGGLFKGGATQNVLDTKLDETDNRLADGVVVKNNPDNEGYIFTVPLQFWFCRNVGLALPLIALQYHEVKVILDHNYGNIFKEGSNRLYADYIYLDTDERRRFAQVSHEYLIEQVQEQQLLSQAKNNLNFNHPVKELIWTKVKGRVGSDDPQMYDARQFTKRFLNILSSLYEYKNSQANAENDPIATNGPEPESTPRTWEDFLALTVVEILQQSFPKIHYNTLQDILSGEITEANAFEKMFPWQLFSSDGTALTNPVSSLSSTVTLKLNGHDRFSARPVSYFSRTQVLDHHTGAGGCDVKISMAKAMDRVNSLIAAEDDPIMYVTSLNGLFQLLDINTLTGSWDTFLGTYHAGEEDPLDIKGDWNDLIGAGEAAGSWEVVSTFLSRAGMPEAAKNNPFFASLNQVKQIKDYIEGLENFYHQKDIVFPLLCALFQIWKRYHSLQNRLIF